MDTILLIKDFIWDYLLVFLLVFAGLYLTVKLGFIQFTKLGQGFKELKKSKRDAANGLVTPLEAFYTSLAAQIGTGNIAGVAAAIMLGGWKYILDVGFGLFRYGYHLFRNSFSDFI